MLTALLYTFGGGLVLRIGMISFQDFDNYYRYGIVSRTPLTVRRVFYSYYFPLCMLVGYLNYYLEEPPLDYLMKKYYCG